jgi:hypothetical protein
LAAQNTEDEQTEETPRNSKLEITARNNSGVFKTPPGTNLAAQNTEDEQTEEMPCTERRQAQTHSTEPQKNNYNELQKAYQTQILKLKASA